MSYGLETLSPEQDANGKWWLVWPDFHTFSGPFTSKEAAEAQLAEIIRTCQ